MTTLAVIVGFNQATTAAKSGRPSARNSLHRLIRSASKTGVPSGAIGRNLPAATSDSYEQTKNKVMVTTNKQQTNIKQPTNAISKTYVTYHC
jgi:hypothetical protein